MSNEMAEAGITESKPVRGRPPGTTTTPHNLLQDVWLQVEAARAHYKSPTGQLVSVAAACRRIEAGGGLIWIVAGDRDSIIDAMKTPGSSLSRAQRYRVELGDRGPQVIPDKNGPVIATHSISYAQSLRSRYAEANRLVRSNPFIREAWTNMLNNRLGLPRLPRNKW